MSTGSTSPARHDDPFVSLLFFVEETPDLDPKKPRHDVCLYHFDSNACEFKGAGYCDTGAGVYYGTSDKFAGKVCPRHFYESIFGRHKCYTIIDRKGNAA